MIVPLIAIAAIALLAGGAVAASGPRKDPHRHALFRKLTKNTLVATGPGLYSVQYIPNTTPAIVHVQQTVMSQNVAAYIVPNGTAVLFRPLEEKAHWLSQGWELFLAPGQVVR